MELTSEGLVIDTVDEIIADMEADLKTKISPNLDTNPETSVIGQFIGIIAEREHHNQQVLLELYNSGNPSGASGQALTSLSKITGTVREDATHSTVTATLNLNAGVLVESGSRANVDGAPDVQFETTEDIENTGGSPANFDTVMRAVNPGPVRANAGTLTEITTPVTGWNSVTNALDAALGTVDENDPTLRARREAELRLTGASALDAIVADVLDVENVVSAIGRENTTDTPDGDLPAHSFQIVVWDGVGGDAEDNDIAQSIWNSKPAGILSYGVDSGEATDRQGNVRVVYFSRATQVELYIEADIVTDPDTFPGDGFDLVKEALVAAAGTRWTVGADAVPSALVGAVFAVPGIVAVPEIRIGESFVAAANATYSIDFDEIGIADTSRVNVFEV